MKKREKRHSHFPVERKRGMAENSPPVNGFLTGKTTPPRPGKWFQGPESSVPRLGTIHPKPWNHQVQDSETSAPRQGNGSPAEGTGLQSLQVQDKNGRKRICQVGRDSIFSVLSGFNSPLLPASEDTLFINTSAKSICRIPAVIPYILPIFAHQRKQAD